MTAEQREKIRAKDRERYQREKERRIAYARKYYSENREEGIKQRRAYRAAHLEEIRAYDRERNKSRAEYRREYDKQYREENREEIRVKSKAKYERTKHERPEKLRRKYAENPQHKAAVLLRTRLGLAIRQKNKSGSAVRLLGCTIPELLLHIESQFLPGMTWKNWSRKGWHIDHKTPLAKFDLTDPEQLAKACHFSNLQPMWWEDNLRKWAHHPQTPAGC